MNTPPPIEKPARVNLALLIAAVVLTLLNTRIGYVRAFRESHNVAESMGAGTFSLIFPMIVAALFAIGKKFRNPASATKIGFWTSLIIFLSAISGAVGNAVEVAR